MIELHEKADLIRFIENSTDEENIQIAIFIAGMQAQKNIGAHPQDYLPEKTRKQSENQTA